MLASLRNVKLGMWYKNVDMHSGSRIHSKRQYFKFHYLGLVSKSNPVQNIRSRFGINCATNLQDNVNERK